jgi:hypothetical protein
MHLLNYIQGYAFEALPGHTGVACTRATGSARLQM